MTVMQGSSQATGGDLDLAIEGSGYLEVTLPSGVSAYTRDGGLKRSAEGQVVTSDGYPVVPDITIPDDTRSISINAAGEVYAYFDDQIQPQLLGQLTLSGPDALAKARLASDVVWKRLAYDGCEYSEEEKLIEYLGANVTHAGNLIGNPEAGFGSDTNRVTLFFADGSQEVIPEMEKEVVAHILLNRIVERLLPADSQSAE